MRQRLSEAHLDAWRALLNSHAVLIGRVEDALGEAGLPPLAWYDVLWPLHRAPGRRLRMRDLAREVVILGRSGLTRLVDRLEAAGMLERHPVADDARGVEIAITADGSRMLRRMWPVYERVLRDHVEGVLDDGQARVVAELLGRLAREAGTPRPRRRMRADGEIESRAPR
jgi:DNA-binding MarR family transcriptional regulator